jgi:hypothetical protein
MSRKDSDSFLCSAAQLRNIIPGSTHVFEIVYLGFHRYSKMQSIVNGIPNEVILKSCDNSNTTLT